MTILIDTAKKYAEAGLTVIPVKGDKTPSISSWTQYQKRRPAPAEIETMFAADATGVAIVCGTISGGLECLDFDDKGSAFDGWKQKIPLGLYTRLTVERSPSGGYHVYYRCRNTGRRTVFNRFEGKRKITLIEVRGEGHYTLCDPSPRYVLEQGNLFNIPEITPEERKILVDAARSFDETPSKSSPTKTPTAAPLKAQSNPAMPAPADLRPGDDFNQRATMEGMRTLLEDSGWTFHHEEADRLHFTRPGKSPNEGESGNLMLQNGVPIFYNHSSNAPDVPSEQGLNPFSLYCHLKHNDTAEAAASALRRDGYGGNRKDVNLVSSPAVPAGTADNAGDDGESIHRDLESWTEFPLQCLPKMTRRWVEEKSEAMNVDPSYLAMSILTQASALIGAKYQIDLHRGDWKPFPVLWTFLVGNSSQKKSPCISSCLNMLIDKEREIRNENTVALNEYAIKLSDYEAELKRRRKSEEDELPEKPTRPPERVLTVTGDFTMNGLIKAASDNQWGFLICSDEITTILNAQIATKKGEPMLGELAKFYKGDSSQTRFKNPELNVYAERCLAAILTAGTPGNVRKLIAGTENATNGFVSRLLMIYPPMPEKFCRAGVNENTTENMKGIMEYLVDLEPDSCYSTMRGMLGEEIQCVEYFPHTIHLDGSEGVDSQWLKWQEDIFYKIRESNDELEASLLGKSEELLPRLALLLNILKGAERYVAEGKPTQEVNIKNSSKCIVGTYIPRRVSQATWKEAETLTNWLIDECRAVHQILGLSATRNSNKDVMASIEKLVEGMRKKGISKISVSRIGDYVSQARGKDAKAKDLINRIVAYAAKDKRFSIRQGEYNGRPVQYLKLLDR
ncbi:MAG: DUF3987 domain-containing protein [Thermoguttaceae bacterium]|nr:DUF3987 domain-containing protein [Thermoguttaceae bacterium]